MQASQQARRSNHGALADTWKLKTNTGSFFQRVRPPSPQRHHPVRREVFVFSPEEADRECVAGV